MRMHGIMKMDVSGKDLLQLGYPQGEVIGVALKVVDEHFSTRRKAMLALKKVIKQPEAFTNDPVWKNVAQKLIPVQPARVLREKPVDFSIFGAQFIDESAVDQMRLAASLPVSVAGALMPDAHHGYGLPIGGVLATENAIIPYGVGVDIGCRMALSLFDLPPGDLDTRRDFFIGALHDATLFGAGKEFKKAAEHAVLDRAEFEDTPLLQPLRQKAALQLGSSGSGNHFVEFGFVDIPQTDPALQIPPGKYIGLLSHSGSRGLGATIANFYTKLAREKRGLTGNAAHLSWLYLDEAEGIEYWKAMNLAGDYAAANHEIIHRKIAAALGQNPVQTIENHHNFAWKEVHDGREVIVHRKGATPAATNQLGIIPGSMTAPAYLVKGRGHLPALSSASHGAGRAMSRTAALKTFSKDQLSAELKKHGVTLLSAGLDEAPFAYKEIRAVIGAQQDLVDILGTFTPKIVKMDS